MTGDALPLLTTSITADRCERQNADSFSAFMIAISDQVLSQQVSGETVLLDLASEQYFGLNEVGSRFWELLAEGMVFDAIIQTMTAEFDVSPKQIAQDLEELLATLSAAGLVRITPAGQDHTV